MIYFQKLLSQDPIQRTFLLENSEKVKTSIRKLQRL